MHALGLDEEGGVKAPSRPLRPEERVDEIENGRVAVGLVR